jgi:hypothetical protein
MYICSECPSGMRLDLYVRSPPSAGILVRPFPRAIVEVPGPIIDSMSSQLCSSLVLVKTIHRTLAQTDARPWLNSSAPLLANLTTFDLYTVCKGVVIQAGPATHCTRSLTLRSLTLGSAVSAVSAARHTQQPDHAGEGHLASQMGEQSRVSKHRHPDTGPQSLTLQCKRSLTSYCLSLGRTAAPHLGDLPLCQRPQCQHHRGL